MAGAEPISRRVEGFRICARISTIVSAITLGQQFRAESP